jgi:predicted transcriptional regulator
MGNILTIRLPRDLEDWLDEAARKSGLSRGAIVRRELERARQSGEKPWMRLVGSIEGLPADLSTRKGFSRK